MYQQLVRYEPQRASDIRLLASPKPFSAERIDIEFPAGKTVAEILRELKCYPYPGTWALVTVGDVILPQEWWEHCRPKPGQVMTVRLVPQGGGRGGGKSFLGIFIGIIITVLFWWAGGAGWGAIAGTGFSSVGGAVGAMIGGMVAGLVVRAITPPPQTKLPSSNVSDPRLSITGTQNVANRYGPICKIFGKPPPFYPNLGADPFTEILGDEQYLRMLFVVGYGPLKLDVATFKIGETPLLNFAGVEYEIREGWPNDPPMTLFSYDIFEDRFAIKLTQTATGSDYHYFIRTTRPNTDEITIDVLCPQGLFKIDQMGNRIPHQVRFFFQYAPVGVEGWYTVPDPIDGQVMTTISDNRSGEVRRSFRVIVPRGQYNVRLARTTVNPNNVNAVDELYWSVLRSVSYTDPWTMPGVAKVAIRIKASDQLNGVVDKFSLVVESYLPVWDGTNWTTQLTRNPAWANTEVLRSFYGGNKRPVGDNRLDLAGFKAWADKNDAEVPPRTFDVVVDSRTTVSQLLRDIPASARSRRSWKEGKYSVIWDRIQNVAVQQITPKNSFNYKGFKNFGDQPHALKVRFRNAAITVPDVTTDEWIVLDDGYSWDYGDGRGRVDAFGDPSTLPLAEKFEAIDLFGVTSTTWAWKDGRYHIASGRLRPELHEVGMDVEYVRCTPGDLVRFSHDVPLFGLMSGRIKSVTLNGSGEATAITFDELIEMEAGKDYSLRIRTPEGELYPTVVTDVGETDTLTFTAAITGSVQPHQGDLATFGETGLESADMLVKDIMPGRDLTARILMVDYAPNIHLAETGTIPPFVTHITRPASIEPSKPSISQVLSDESVLLINEDGSLSSRILMTFTYPSAFGQNIAFQARYRRSFPGATWTTLPLLPADAREVSFTPVEDGQTYDVAIRAIQQTKSLASEWAERTGHLVVGKTTRPPDVTTFFLEGDVLTWLYPTPPRDFGMGGFLLRRNPGNDRTWSNALPLHSGVWPESPFFIGNLGSGLQTFLIKAVDSSGNESVNAAIIVKDLGDPVFQNIVLEDDHRALGWPGDITNGDVVAGDLVARTISTLFWSSDGALFWSGNDDAQFWHGNFWTDDAAPFWRGDSLPFWGEVFGSLVYEAEATPNYLDRGSRLLLDIDAGGATYKAEYSTGSEQSIWSQNEDTPLWSDNGNPFWMGEPDFQLWPGQVTATRQKYRFRITLPSGPQTRLEQFRVLVDAPDIEEDFNDVVIAVGGTNLPLTKSYRGIKSITYGLNFDSANHPNARTVETLDKQAALTGVFDSSHNFTTGLVDATVRGF